MRLSKRNRRGFPRTALLASVLALLLGALAVASGGGSAPHTVAATTVSVNNAAEAAHTYPGDAACATAGGECKPGEATRVAAAGPPTSKPPILAWAGQRVVLENYWGDPSTGACEGPAGPVDPAAIVAHGTDDRFGVLYAIQSGLGAITGAPLGETHGIDQTASDAIVHVSTAPQDDNGDGITDPNSNCTSRIIVESEDQTEMDVSAYVVNDSDNLVNATPLSQQVAFVIYFMKFESEQLQLIPDSNPPDANGGGTDTWDNGGSPTTGPVTATVSDNVAAVVHVKGWVLTDNCPARPQRTATGNGDGVVGEYFPANRCIFPDDWAFKAGLVPQPEMDIASTTPYSSLCPGGHVAGPFSMLDQITHAGLPVGCADSLAPYPPANAGASAGCLTGGLTYACRGSNFPDGQVNADDAPMPPSLVQFNLTGSGFLTGIGKAAAGVDTGFNSAAIPAEPWISQINADAEGYVWNTWGAGAHSGLYNYWTDLAAHGPEVISCAGPSSGLFVDPNNPGANPCVNDPAPLGPCTAPGAGSGCVRTGGYAMTKVYSDEHGVAMTLINGDANLDFSDCTNSSAGAGHDIILLNGFYCAKGAAVGTSTLTAIVDYPDKRKHFAEVTNIVTINWMWNGTKDVTVEADPNDTTGQYHYVVFHVTDRDGFCGSSDSLHPVLHERVDFLIDSTAGIIAPDFNGNPAEAPVAVVSGNLKSATTHTFDTAAGVNSQITVTPVQVDGECQAWIHVVESLLNPVDVIVTAFDPEGTVTFDAIINPTPTPTPVPTPTQSPTPTPTQSPTPAPTQSPTPTPTQSPTPTPAQSPTPTATSTASPPPQFAPEATAAVVGPGGSVTTDTESDGATPSDPVESTVTSPNGGAISIQETSFGGPNGYNVLGQLVTISAPPASAADPLTLVFEIDASLLPVGGVDNVQIFKNGADVPDCTGAPQAIPDPCVASRITLGNGNGQITIFTSTASAWDFGIQTAWGNVDCSTDGITGVDIALLLKHIAIPGFAPSPEACPDVGSQVTANGVHQHWGNLDCSTDSNGDGIDGRDVLADLFHLASLTPPNVAGCPAPDQMIALTG